MVQDECSIALLRIVCLNSTSNIEHKKGYIFLPRLVWKYSSFVSCNGETREHWPPFQGLHLCPGNGLTLLLLGKGCTVPDEWAIRVCEMVMGVNGSLLSKEVEVGIFSPFRANYPQTRICLPGDPRLYKPCDLRGVLDLSRHSKLETRIHESDNRPQSPI